MESTTTNLLNHTVTSPHKKNLMFLLNVALLQLKSTVAGFKSTHDSMEKIPLIILDMEPFLVKQGRHLYFGSLVNAMRGQMDTMSIPDLVTIVATEVSIDTIASFLEATEMKKDVFTSIVNVLNLTGVCFLNSTGWPS